MDLHVFCTRTGACCYNDAVLCTESDACRMEL
jgi:hypothetical protein